MNNINDLNNRIKSCFLDVNTKGNYLRIVSDSILDLYLGLSNDNLYTLEFRGEFKPKKIESSEEILVRQYKQENYNSLMFSLKDNSMLEVFCVFCSDIVESTSNANNKIDGYNIIIDRYYSWRKLFHFKALKFSESQIMGMIGELLFIKDYLMPKYGIESAIHSWVGQELTHKDFSIDNVWYEVKAMNSGKESVTISSLEQLQSQTAGQLVIVSLEKMSLSYNGITLNKLNRKILQLISSFQVKDEYLEKLFNQGYRPIEEYDQYVYEKKYMERYSVCEDFPKLTINNIPKGIIKAQYDIDLTSIRNFKID